MTYYILMDMDTPEDIWDENILGEESFGKFYTGNGYKAFAKMVDKDPDALNHVLIMDEKKHYYTITEFLDVIKDWKIKLDF
jgi:hypothetical protein